MDGEIMKHRFVAKKRRGGFIVKLILWILIASLALTITFNILFKSSLKGLLGSESLQDNLFSFATNQKNFLSLDLLNPKDLFTIGLNHRIDYSPLISTDELKLMTKHENSSKPRVYLYSSHDTETYDSTLTEAYNIKYNVTIGNYILSDYLRDLGIPTYVERESMAEYLKNNGLNYNYSYQASKYYMLKRLEEYPSIEMVIDIHRDALPRYASVATIDGKPCAKVIFIVAIEYEGYEKNVALAEKMNSHLPAGLSRGLSKGNGYGANGYFNQELKENALLIEIGGTENTIEEVANTMKHVANAIFEVIGKE